MSDILIAIFRRRLEACMRQFEQSIDMLCQAEGEGLTGSSTSTTSAPSATQPFNREITDNNVPYPRSSGRHNSFVI